MARQCNESALYYDESYAVRCREDAIAIHRPINAYHESKLEKNLGILRNPYSSKITIRYQKFNVNS